VEHEQEHRGERRGGEQRGPARSGRGNGEGHPTAPPKDAEAADSSLAQTVGELEDRLRRVLADMDNMRKRYERELARERAAERARVAKLWLPVVDDLERALEHAGADPATLLEGVRTVRDEAVAVLARLGYPRYDDVGRGFDPTRHEAVGAVDSEESAGNVVVTVSPGYGADDDILRPARVVVARGSG
jgi:molecular chaperone GrpE